jgi:hypothetical protein
MLVQKSPFTYDLPTSAEQIVAGLTMVEKSPLANIEIYSSKALFWRMRSTG